MSAPLHVLGCGAVTSVGFTAPQSCAAIRAAITGFVATGFRDTRRGPTIWAPVPLEPGPLDTTEVARRVTMASLALEECVAASGVDPGLTALLLGVREALHVGGSEPRADTALIEAIEDRTGYRFHSRSRVVPGGNGAALEGVAAARELLVRGEVGACLVGGVDTLLRPADMQRLGAAYRLRSDAVARGFVPGEAAAFVALGARAGVGRRTAQVLGVGLAREPAATTVQGAEPSSGRALEQAICAALADAQVEEARVTCRLSDANGEEYRGLENLLATARAYRTRRPTFPALMPAACVGETGAAAGALLLVVAATALERGYLPGRLAMCETSSDGGLRAACLVAGPS